MKISNDKLKKVLSALASFIWLGNNIHNFYTPEFRKFFEAALIDAKEAYQILLDYGVHNK